MPRQHQLRPVTGGDTPSSNAPSPDEASEAATTTAPESSLENRIFRALRKIMRATAIYSRDLQARHQVTVPQLTCLHAIARMEPATATRIAREVQLSPSTMVGIIDRLEAAGLVRRDRDATDRRVVNISMTEHGLRLVAREPMPLQAELARGLASLPELEQATIALSLERLVALLQAGTLDASPILATGTEVAPEADATPEKSRDSGSAA